MSEQQTPPAVRSPKTWDLVLFVRCGTGFMEFSVERTKLTHDERERALALLQYLATGKGRGK